LGRLKGGEEENESATVNMKKKKIKPGKDRFDPDDSPSKGKKVVPYPSEKGESQNHERSLSV